MRLFGLSPFFLVGLFTVFPATFAATFTVTTNANEGEGSLRKAIDDANANPGPDVIEFNISGTGPHVIAPLTPFKPLTGPVIIDGYSQPGSRPNQLAEGSDAVIRIEIDGSNNILASGLIVAADDVTIQGLAIYGFTNGEGILLRRKRNATIVGNYLGTDSTGQVAKGNFFGINGENSSDNTIGSIDPGGRNVISGNASSQINFTRGRGSKIFNNIVGPDRTLTKPLFATGFSFDDQPATGQPKTGIYILGGSDYQIGGSDPGLANVIGGHSFAGIAFYKVESSAISGNRVGLASDLGNGEGISLIFCETIQIGDRSDGAGNTIAFNERNGITINYPCESISVHENSIHSNGGLGIDLADELERGVTENDDNDKDSGPNQFQNFPVIFEATSSDGILASIKGVLRSEPEKRYLVELFANNVPDPSGHGEGQLFLSSFYVDTDYIGHALFERTVSAESGIWISSTATESVVDPEDPTGHTSEFSEPEPIVGFTFTVSNTDPDGEGSLRWAIEQANAADTSKGQAIIEFELEGDGPFVFPIDEPLVLENDNVVINGRSQTGTRLNRSKDDFDAEIQIQLDGSQSNVQTGLRIEGNLCEVNSISFVGFDGAAISISGSQNTVSGSSFGVDVTDISPSPNGSAIEVTGGQNNLIGGGSARKRNYITNCQSAGILLTGEGTMNTRVLGNLIEENLSDGISIESTYGNFIGSPAYDYPSIIRDNDGAGVRDDSELGNWIRGIHWGNLDLPLDIGPAGETPNDEPDVDGVSNVPQIDSALISSDGREVLITGRYVSPAIDGLEANMDMYLTNGEGASSGRWIGSGRFPLESDGVTDFSTVLWAPFERVGLGANLSFTAALRSPAMPLGTSEVGGAVVALAQSFIQTEITRLSLKNDATQVTFTTNFGGAYDVQRSTDLEPQGWQNLAAGVEGTGDEVTVEDANGDSVVFYRVAETLPELPIDYNTLETVALAGQPASGGSSGTYAEFFTPSINGEGAVAFVAQTDVRDIEFATDFFRSIVVRELFSREPSGAVNGLLLSTQTTNVAGEFFTFGDENLEAAAPFAISDTGHVAGVGLFFAGVSTGQNIRFVASPSGVRKFDAEGAIVTAGDPDELIWDNGGRFTLPLLIDDSGNAIYSAVLRLDGTLNSSGSAIRYFSTADSDTLAQTIVRDEQPIPTGEDTYTSVSLLGINAGGDILYSGTFGVPGPDQSRILVARIGETDTILLQDSFPAPGFPESEGVLLMGWQGGLQLNADRTYAFGASLGDTTGPPFSQYLLGQGGEGIYFGSFGSEELTLVIAQEQAAALFDAPGSFVNAVGFPRLTDSGLIAFAATYGPDHNVVSGKGLFVYDTTDGSTRRIYKTGDPIDEGVEFGPFVNFPTTNEVRVSDDHNTFAINDSGELAFLAEVGPQNETALFFADSAGELTLIAKVGDPFELPGPGGTPTVSDILFQGGGNSSGQAVGFNDSGQVAFGLLFSGAETPSGLFLYNPPSLTE